MAKMKFGAWIPTYAWSGGKSDPKNVKRIRESIEKCEDHGIDVWVIDHLLSAPGLYGNAWLEPLNSLAFAAALTSKVKIATGILVLPVRHPVVLAKEISTLCHLSENRYMFGVGPGWYAREYEVTGSRIEERGKRTDEIIEAVTLLLTKPNASFHGKYYQFNDVTIEPRPPKMPAIWVSGGSRVPDPTDHDVPVIATTVMDRIVKAGNWLSRCSGKQEWVKRDWAAARAARRRRWGRTRRSSPSATATSPTSWTPRATTRPSRSRRRPSSAPWARTGRYEHLQECYMVGGIDRINARIEDLRKSGLEYLVLGPVSDDPKQIDLMAKKVVKAFK